MRSRHLETVAVGGLGSLLGAALFAILHDTLSQTIGRQLSRLEVVAGVVIFALPSLLLAIWLWRHLHSTRCRILALTQRRIAHFAVGIMLGAVPGVAAYFALLIFGIPPLPPPPFALPAFLAAFLARFLAVACGVAVCLVCAAGLYGVFRRWDRPEVTAAQCAYVLRIIDRERAAGGGRFPFLEAAPAFEIRRQCRILDFLPRYEVMPSGGKPVVVTRMWSYRINPPDTDLAPAVPSTNTAPEPNAPSPDLPRPGSSAADADDSAPTASAQRKHEQDEYAHAIERLTNRANDLCANGATKGYWRTSGAPLRQQPNQLYVQPFFGNKFDYLFNGGDGYRVGGLDGPRFITMVIKGQPGAGKSTSALQLCTTLARHGNICIYYSLEEEREGLFETANDFGWQQPEDRRYFPGDGEADYQGVQIQKVLYNRLNMVKRQGVKPRIDELLGLGKPPRSPSPRGKAKHAEGASDAAAAGSDTPLVGAVLVSSLGNRAMAVKERMRQLRREWEELPDVLPRCVVIDSLEGFANVGLRGGGEDENAPSGKPGVLRGDFLAIKDFFRNRCDMLVVVVEDDGTGKPGYVDFVADTVIQLGRRIDGGYVILSAEVRKARNQMHALGQHQVKIRSLRDIKRASVASSVMGDDPKTAEHGLLIYPSLDYVLSQSRGLKVYDEHTLSTGFYGLDKLLGADRAGGMKRQSSAALLGPGTTGKSLIAMNFLIEGVRENRPTLLLSLRDDIGIITSKPHPQERGRLRFSWRKGPGGDSFHQIEWPVAYIAQWLKTRSAPGATDTVELPYLLRDQAARLRDANPWQDAETKATLIAYMQQVVASCPAVGDTWSEDALSALDALWHNFARRAGASLAMVEDERRHGALRPQQPSLADARGVPVLRWNSPAELSSGKLKYVNDLLVVKSWRPGRIAPEDFLNWLLGVIGDPKDDKLRFSRVVFDDVSQLDQRFPLLAESRLFLPTLVDLFKAKRIASIFLAGYDDKLGLPTNTGLDVLADHVIRTRIERHKGTLSSQPSGASSKPTASDNSSPPRQVDVDDDARHRTIVVDVDTRPGSRRLPPHELVIDEDSEFADIRPMAGITDP